MANSFRDDIDQAEFAAWYRDNTKTSSDIAAHFGVNKGSLSYYAHRFGVKMRPKGTGFYSKEANSQRQKAAKRKVVKKSDVYRPQETIKMADCRDCGSCRNLPYCLEIKGGPVLCEVYLFLDENPAHQDADPVSYYTSPDFEAMAGVGL